MLPAHTRAYHQYLRFLRRWHRFSVEGLDHLLSPGPKLLVGYHGRGMPMDLGHLGLLIYEQKGYLPKTITHAVLHKIPGVRELFVAWGAIPGDGPQVQEAIERGEVLILAPGGAREGLRTFRERYQVDWGHHRGYLKFALKHKLPIVPVGSSGVDDRFIGLNNGHALGKALNLPDAFPLWLGVGVGGIFPFAMPLPSKIHTEIGAPMHLGELSSLSPGSKEHLDELHEKVTAKVQGLLDLALNKSPNNKN